MYLSIKKLLFLITFNFSLFLLLMIGIQNSSNQARVNFIQSESVKLPISFIVGISFISGSLTGSLIANNLPFQKDDL